MWDFRRGEGVPVVVKILARWSPNVANEIERQIGCVGHGTPVSGRKWHGDETGRNEL